MPSGSHARFGGGSRGGGGSRSHSGGSSRSFSSGHHSPHPPRPVRPFRFHWGHTVYVIPPASRSKINGKLFATLIFGFFALVSCFMLVLANQNIAFIKSDREGYIDMINKAKSNPELVVDGKVTNVFQDPNYPSKWYFEYVFTAKNGEIVKEGASYSVYDSRHSAPAEGEIVKLAVPRVDTTGDSDSIPMDYIEYGIEKDADYISAKSAQKTAKIFLTISICGIVLFITLAVVSIIKSKQKEEEYAKQTANTNANAVPNKNPNVCEYCGGRISTEDKYCNSCGARINF